MDDRALAVPPQQERSRKSTERAIEGAIEVIRDAGWNGFSIPVVSERTGLSVPLLQRRFGSKDELFLAAQATVSERIESDALVAFYSSPRWDGLSARDTVRLATECLASLNSRYGRLLRGFHERGLDDDRVSDRAELTVALKHRLYRERLLRFRDEMALEDPEIGVDVCFVSMSAVLSSEQKFNDLHTDPPGWERLVRELAEASIAYLLDGSGPALELELAGTPVPAATDGAGRTRERLLQSGVELLAERDYRGLTAVAVSERVGLGVSSLYHVFENKDELIAEVERVALDKLLSEAAAALPARRTVAGAVAELVDLIDGNGAAVRVLINRRPGADLEHAGEVLDTLRDLFCTALCAGGQVQRRDPGYAAALCFQIVYCVLTSYVPRDRHLMAEMRRGRFYGEQARLCARYLAALA